MTNITNEKQEISTEIKRKVKELNKLIVKANGLGLKIEHCITSLFDTPEGNFLEIKITEQIEY